MFPGKEINLKLNTNYILRLVVVPQGCTVLSDINITPFMNRFCLPQNLSITENLQLKVRDVVDVPGLSSRCEADQPRKLTFDLARWR